MTYPAAKLPGLDEKTRFLLAPQSYPEGTAEVRLVETHMARVFLTDRFVYKMKKPMRSGYLDFSSLDKRCNACREELRLNRRLTDGVYLELLALRVDAAGGLTLEPRDGAPVECLVKMRRLPADTALPRLIGGATPETLAPLLRRLCDFYGDAQSIEMSAAQYLERLRRQIEHWRDGLLDAPLFPGSGTFYNDAFDNGTLGNGPLNSNVVNGIARELLDFIQREAQLLGERAESGRIVEGHGDLRPEHCFLTRPPQVIDCLEFNRDLRCVDPLDELSYLALECELLGRPDLGEAALRSYYQASDDRPAERLSRFYRAERALLRAHLAAAHLQDGVALRWDQATQQSSTELAEPEKWRRKTAIYLAAARRHCLNGNLSGSP